MATYLTYENIIKIIDKKAFKVFALEMIKPNSCVFTDIDWYLIDICMKCLV